MNKKIKNELTDKLFECILSMETVEECYQLFEDLCTINEIQAIAQRMEVAAMLVQADLCGNCGKNRRFHSNYQPCQSLPALRHGWL